MKAKSRFLYPAAAAAMLATLTMTSPSRAADQTWNPGGPTDNWSTLAGDENWGAGFVWTATNNAIFGDTGETVYLGENVAATNLTFSTAGYGIDGSGFTLTLANGSIIRTDADAVINATLAGGPIIKTGTGVLTLGGNNTFAGGITVRGGTLKLGNGGALNSTAPNDVTLGLGGDSNPTLDVNGQSFNMASLTVGDTGATIRTNAWGGPYVKGITTLNGPLTVYRYGNNVHEGFQNEGRITGNGAGSGNVSIVFNREGSNNYYWQANNTVANDFLGNIQVKGGELRHQGTGAINNTVVPDSAMIILDSGSAWSWNNSGTVTETLDGLASGNLGSGNGGRMYRNIPQYTLTINANNPDNEGKRIYEGTLESMSGNLTFDGSGTQEFRGANPKFTNTSLLNNGTLRLTNTNNWASQITFGAANSPKLQLNAPLVTDAWSFSKQITGANAAAAVEKTGAGTVTLTTPQTYQGATTVSAGKLLVSSGTLLPTDFPTIPGMAVWLDAADPEADGDTTVPTDGTEVAVWKNKGNLGTAADFTATETGTGNPLYKASEAAFNGRPVVNFSATKKMLANTVNYTNTVSVVYVGRIGATKQRLVSGGTVNWLLGYWNGNMNTNYWNGGSLGSTADTNPHIWINGATNGGNAKGYRFDAAGEVTLGDGTGGAGPTAGLTLGGAWNASERSDGDIAELFVFDHQLTSTERQALEGYLYKKYYGSQFGIVGLDPASPVTVAASGTFGGNGGAGNITVENGGTLQGGMDNGTGTLTMGSLTISGTATLKGGVSATPGGKAISVTNFTVNGGAQSVLLAGTAGAGLTDGSSYDFLTWSGTTNVTDASVFKQVVRNLTPTLDLVNKKLQLTYSAAGSSIYWTGGTSAWNATASNWKQTSDNSVTTFMVSDTVLFHDTTGSATVDISDADVSPASTTFDNTAAGTSYVISGSKGIVSGTITKLNDGTVTINNVNPTNGAVTLNGGTVSVAQNGGLGTGGLAFDGGAKLHYTGASSSSNRSVAINNAIGAGGGIVDVVEPATSLLGGALTGAGTLTKAGAGALGFSGDGSYAGAITLAGGTLAANHANAFGTGAATLVMGDSTTGANPVEFRVDTAVAGGVKLASITNSNHGTAQTITLNTGGALAANAAGLVTTLNLTGSVPITLKGTNTGGHGTAQDVNWRIEGAGIPAGSTALILDGTAYSIRSSQLSDTSAASSFTGDVLIRGNVTTQGRTYLAGGGTVAENQNLNFASNDVTLEAGAVWRIVWGGETIGALNGDGEVVLNNQNALNNIGLTLGNTGRNGAFAGRITGNFGLAKKGVGTQVLSGSGSSYSGPTIIEGGTLQVDGSKTGGAAVTVKPYAILSGTGTVGGTTTVEGFGAVSPAGASTLGEMTLGGLTLQGVYQCNLDDTTADLLRVNGTLTFSAGAEIQFIGTPVADRYTIASFSTLDGGLPAITAPAGYSVAVDTQFGEIVLRKSTAYDVWAAGFDGFANTAPDADPDGDGIANMIEFVLGGDPRVSSTDILPKSSVDGAYLVLSFKRSDASEAGTTLTGWWSTNLESWLDTDVIITSTSENGAAPDDMTIRIPLAKALNGRLFGRLGVSMP